MIGKLIFALGLIGTTVALGQVENPDDVSPFRTPVARPDLGTVDPVVAPTSLDNFQFNGFMIMDGKVRVSLHDVKENKSFWVREGQLGEYGLSFLRFDGVNESVVIAQGGIQKKLELTKVQIDSLKVSNPRANPSNPENTPLATRARPAGNVETDEEARARIQRVAEEIRRRRAERRRQLENRNSGGSN